MIFFLASWKLYLYPRRRMVSCPSHLIWQHVTNRHGLQLNGPFVLSISFWCQTCDIWITIFPITWTLCWVAGKRCGTNKSNFVGKNRRLQTRCDLCRFFFYCALVYGRRRCMLRYANIWLNINGNTAVHGFNSFCQFFGWFIRSNAADAHSVAVSFTSKFLFTLWNRAQVNGKVFDRN